MALQLRMVLGRQAMVIKGQLKFDFVPLGWMGKKENEEEWERALADFARKYEKGQANIRNKDDLIRQLTIKREKKLETLHSKRKEQQAADSSYSSSAYPSTPPPPQPPSCSKREIYTSTEYFSSIDEVAIHCARSEMTTFT
ncbi:unnamed protein product, partial [Strongylus vulgaris]